MYPAPPRHRGRAQIVGERPSISVRCFFAAIVTSRLRAVRLEDDDYRSRVPGGKKKFRRSTRFSCRAECVIRADPFVPCRAEPFPDCYPFLEREGNKRRFSPAPERKTTPRRPVAHLRWGGGGGPGVWTHPGSEFSTRVDFSSTFENTENANIQYEKFNGLPPPQKKKKKIQNPPLPPGTHESE